MVSWKGARKPGQYAARWEGGSWARGCSMQRERMGVGTTGLCTKWSGAPIGWRAFSNSKTVVGVKSWLGGTM